MVEIIITRSYANTVSIAEWICLCYSYYFVILGLDCRNIYIIKINMIMQTIPNEVCNLGFLQNFL